MMGGQGWVCGLCMWLVTGFPGQGSQMGQWKQCCSLWPIFGSHIASFHHLDAKWRRNRDPPLDGGESMSIESAEQVRHDNGTMFGKYNPSLKVWELDYSYQLPISCMCVCVCVCTCVGGWVYCVFPLSYSYPWLPPVWNLTLEKAPYLSIFWAMGHLGRECQALFSTF